MTRLMLISEAPWEIITTLMSARARKMRSAIPTVECICSPTMQRIALLFNTETSANCSRSFTMSSSRFELSMVSDTATSEVATRSTGVVCLLKTEKIDSRKPYAISMRVDWMLMTVIPFLEAIDFTAALDFGGSAMIRVPVEFGRFEFRTMTGMFFFTAGRMVLG